MKSSKERVIIVTRNTRLQESIKRFNTVTQAKFVIEQRGHSFDDYQLEDDNYQQAQENVLQALPQDLKFQVIDRSFLPNFLFTDKDIVLTLGQDGLVSNTAKYLSGQPIVAVNPDPQRFDGILLPYQLGQVRSTLESVLEGRHLHINMTMGRVDLNDGQKLYAFNDFFVGARTHISARYTIEYQKQQERQSSSGVLISTPAGSTGWLSSVYNMTAGFADFAGDPVDFSSSRLPWASQQLVFVVREPFRSKWSGADLVAGRIENQQKLVLRSHMANSGVIFSDGMEADRLEFNSGATATIAIAEKTTHLVVPNKKFNSPRRRAKKMKKVEVK